MRRAAILLILLTSCLPIPVKKTFVTWPKRTIRVVDESGAATAGVKVHVARIRHPHSRTDESRVMTADEHGEVKLERETTVLKVFPLMMHGVPGFSFEACAETKGTARTLVHWSNPDEPTNLELKLLPGSLPCGVELDQTPPAARTARIEGITREDGKFVIAIALPKGDNANDAELLKPGAEPLRVTTVLWQSDPTSLVRRARVHVSGDAMAYAYGDIVLRR